MNDIKYPNIGFEVLGGSSGNRGWCFEFFCGVCTAPMLQHSNALRHSGYNETCPQYRTIFDPVISDEGVFRLRIRILEPDLVTGG